MVVSNVQWSASWMHEAGECDRLYKAEGEAAARPVSGDLTALLLMHEELRALDQRAPRGLRRGVAGGWLQRRPAPAEGVVTVQCDDCPWGLDVQGWADRAMTAQKLAQRHADRRNHTVTARENGR